MNIMTNDIVPKKAPPQPNETGANTAQGVAGLVGSILSVIPGLQPVGALVLGANAAVSAGRAAAKGDIGGAIQSAVGAVSGVANGIKQLDAMPPPANPVDTKPASNPMYRQGLEVPSAVPEAMPTIQPYSPTVRLPMPKLSQPETNSFQFYQGGR